MDRNSIDQAAIIRMTTVALLAEGVDRNPWSGLSPAKSSVALLAEGVDRNTFTARGLGIPPVALLAEGVDRNTR